MILKSVLVSFLVSVYLFAGLTPAGASDPVYWSWAPMPPMGWNSWDGFATTVTEAQTRAQAEVMKKKLAAHGWNLITVDIQWYELGATGFNLSPGRETRHG